MTEFTDIIRTFNEKVTDQGLSLFEMKLNEIHASYSQYPSITPLFRMMQSLRKYLASKKETAHPEAVSVLLSIADRFENIINDPDFHLDKDGNRTSLLVIAEIKKYKALQEKINSKPIDQGMDLNQLKAVILAIEWEISSDTLTNFENIISQFLSAFQENKLFFNFLKILQSLGVYIGTKKANAHPNALSLLRCVYDDLEKIIQHPDMPFEKKKNLLKSNINQFNEFKTELSKENHTADLSQPKDEDEPILPALSHIKPASRVSLGDVVPISAIPETDATGLMSKNDNIEDIKPALVDKKKPEPVQRDVMSDLFSLKESPADQLLDAIHLMDVPGSSKGLMTHMQHSDEISPASGIRQLTPQLKNITPIPEIEDRLDEFFNLESPSKPIHDPEQMTLGKPTELETGVQAEKSEGIVPFQYEDEAFESAKRDGGDTDDEKKEKNDGTADILRSLKSQIDTIDIQNPGVQLLSLEKGISDLKNIWHSDDEKMLILDFLISLMKHIEHFNYQLLNEKNQEKKQAHGLNTVSEARTKPRGIFSKIKSLFTSS